MDPTATVRVLREAIIQLGRLNTSDAPDDVYAATNAVLEHWAALDTWLSNGGFPPAQWGNLTTKPEPVRVKDVDEVLDPLAPDPRGAHASLSALNGAISAGEAVSRKLRGDA